eukprot:scaffold397916_cov17-Prasinocladus_malaysianus.AAC.1
MGARAQAAHVSAYALIVGPLRIRQHQLCDDVSTPSLSSFTKITQRLALPQEVTSTYVASHASLAAATNLTNTDLDLVEALTRQVLRFYPDNWG